MFPVGRDERWKHLLICHFVIENVSGECKGGNKFQTAAMWANFERALSLRAANVGVRMAGTSLSVRMRRALRCGVTPRLQMPLCAPIDCRQLKSRLGLSAAASNYRRASGEMRPSVCWKQEVRFERHAI